MSGFKEKLDGMTDKLKGEAKEKFGKATDNHSKEVEGKIDKAKGEAKEKLGKAKDKTDK